MTSYLLTLAQCGILVFGLRCVAHHVTRRVLRYPLVRRIGDVRQVATGLPLSLVISRRVRAPLWILRVVRLWLNNESRHIILNVLLHQEVVLAIVIDELVLVIAFHYFIHSVIVVEVQGTGLLLQHVVFVICWHFLSMLLHEELQLLVNLIL